MAEMTKAEAAKLQLKWKLRLPVVSCIHLTRELNKEHGILNCLVCGEELETPAS